MPVVDERTANDILDRVLPFSGECFARFGTRLFFCSDEILSKQSARCRKKNIMKVMFNWKTASVAAQHGNGIMSALRQLEPDTPLPAFAIGTGCLAAPFIRELVDKAKERCPAVQGTVYAVVNHYFGETIDVAGLVTATDLMTQLKGQPLGERLLLPVNMLRHGGDIFLDDYR